MLTSWKPLPSTRQPPAAAKRPAAAERSAATAPGVFTEVANSLNAPPETHTTPPSGMGVVGGSDHVRLDWHVYHMFPFWHSQSHDLVEVDFGNLFSDSGCSEYQL